MKANDSQYSDVMARQMNDTRDERRRTQNREAARRCRQRLKNLSVSVVKVKGDCYIHKDLSPV